MKRYFLCLALALLAIPRVSRGDVVLVVQNTGTESQGNNVTNSRTLSFFNNSSNSNSLDSIAIRLYNTTFGTTNLTGTLRFDFSINGGSAVQSSVSILANAQTDYTFSGLSGLLAHGGTNTLTINNAAITSGAGSVALTDLNWTTLTSADYSGSIWTGGSVSPTETSMGLYANVPEPTTMLLSGSAIAIGFGASVFRRLRKKQDGQTAV